MKTTIECPYCEEEIALENESTETVHLVNRSPDFPLIIGVMVVILVLVSVVATSDTVKEMFLDSGPKDIPGGFIPVAVVQNALNNPIGFIDRIEAGHNEDGVLDRWIFRSGSNSLTIVLK
jgi:hypothetical protein